MLVEELFSQVSNYILSKALKQILIMKCYIICSVLRRQFSVFKPISTFSAICNYWQLIPESGMQKYIQCIEHTSRLSFYVIHIAHYNSGK